MKSNINNYPLKIIAAVFLTLATYFLSALGPFSEVGRYTISITTLMIVLWGTDTFPLPVPALIPLFAFPFLGITTLKETATPYSSPIIFLFLGGFLLGLLLEKWDIHKRIAFKILSSIGTNPSSIVLGFMIATGLLSMWISNVAATILMLPIAISIINLFDDQAKFDTYDINKFATSIILSIAYSANVGGIATIVGTPPNAVLIGFLQSNYDIEISFLDWIKIGFPFSISLIFLMHLLLTKVLFKVKIQNKDGIQEIIDAEKRKLGAISTAENLVYIIFCLAILSWILRPSLNIWFPTLGISDVSIAIFFSFLAFTIPSKDKGRPFILEWKDATKVPWGLLILFGGGLSLANGLIKSGVVNIISSSLSDLSSTFPVWLIVLTLISLSIFLTEVLSNLALVTVFLPIAAGIAIGINNPIIEFVLPVTMAASCAFMLPTATPANAVIFSSERFSINQMIKSGIWINLVALLVLFAFARLLIPILV